MKRKKDESQSPLQPVAERRKPAPNPRLALQTRKLLGKHYANKYHTGGR